MDDEAILNAPYYWVFYPYLLRSKWCVNVVAEYSGLSVPKVSC
jgi:hypothetical protein